MRLIEFTTETLSGIPSIIFGLFGMVFFGNALGLGYSILTGALTLTIMILPLITRTTQEALKTVPDSYRHGALGIGATKWYMIRTILLPSAMPGILTGIILAIGRIVGESAALLFTAGSGYYLPKNLFSKIFESGGTLTIQLYLCLLYTSINKNSQHAEDAFKLITYSTKGEFDKKLSEESLGIPSDTTNSEWPVQLTDVKPVMESLKTRYPWAAGAEDNVDMTPIIKENMTKLCSGAITADEFVSNLQAAGK